MQTYIAILRGINVSGQKKIKMNSLKGLFESLGFSHVNTYIQSGNIVFNFEKIDQREISRLIEKELWLAYKYEVPCLVKTSRDFHFIFQNNPFLNVKQEDPSKLHVTFLREKPNQEILKRIGPTVNNGDEFIISENVVYLFCPNGYGKTKFTNSFFENKLKTQATT
ncbi:DUF1697 domain-containing protein, partial [Xanthovirga aplysinae]|uniref:DUF1697 domain-containing protein n=1 Tax=Xanthovirga aplysinae TaxID=2529853 RepID=UPI001656C850